VSDFLWFFSYIFVFAFSSLSYQFDSPPGNRGALTMGSLRELFVSGLSKASTMPLTFVALGVAVLLLSIVYTFV
jgi:hypothetical protein